MNPIPGNQVLNAQHDFSFENQNTDESRVNERMSLLSHKIILLKTTHGGFIRRDEMAQLLAQGVAQKELKSIQNMTCRLVGGGGGQSHSSSGGRSGVSSEKSRSISNTSERQEQTTDQFTPPSRETLRLEKLRDLVQDRTEDYIVEHADEIAEGGKEILKDGVAAISKVAETVVAIAPQTPLGGLAHTIQTTDKDMPTDPEPLQKMIKEIASEKASSSSSSSFRNDSNEPPSGTLKAHEIPWAQPGQQPAPGTTHRTTLNPDKSTSSTSQQEELGFSTTWDPDARLKPPTKTLQQTRRPSDHGPSGHNQQTLQHQRHSPKNTGEGFSSWLVKGSESNKKEDRWNELMRKSQRKFK